MFDLAVRMVSRHNQAQQTRYVTPCAYLGLTVSGLRSWHRLGQHVTDGGPQLTLTPAGETITIDFGPERDNWVVSFDASGLRAMADRPGWVEWCIGGVWISLPALTPLPSALLPVWQAAFASMYEDFRRGDGVAHLRLRTTMAQALRFILDQTTQPVASPMERLRARLAEDLQGRLSVAKEARALGYSPDHLRRRFVASYGLTPVAYRNRQRMTAAMDLITGSDCSLSAIAKRLGFTHASHFAALFRATFAMAPSEALAAYRGG